VELENFFRISRCASARESLTLAVNIFIRADASAFWSLGGINNPLYPDRTLSGLLPTLVAISGLP